MGAILRAFQKNKAARGPAATAVWASHVLAVVSARSARGVAADKRGYGPPPPRVIEGVALRGAYAFPLTNNTDLFDQRVSLSAVFSF